MTRARCNHCDGVFVVGGTRQCCLPGAVAEQKRLRSALDSERAKTNKHKTNDFVDVLLKARGLR